MTIPYNIAPLNFRLEADCQKVEAVFSGRKSSFTVSGKRKIIIPVTKWKKMLEEHEDDSLLVSVSVLNDGKWNRYRPFCLYVSADRIDPFLSYRLIEPGYEVYYKLQICQRNLENFDEKVLADNNLLDIGCINCHTYSFADPERSFFHLRHKKGGTMVQVNGKFRKINTATDSTISSGVYGNWHPGGRYIAFSTNVIIPEFHSINNLRLEVYDTVSDVVALDLENNEIIRSRLLDDPLRFETFPAFSADGKRLFFCSAEAVSMPGNYRQAKYSLCAIDFDPSAGAFGIRIDTLVSARATGKTISEPKPSPDGKYILYTSFGYGNFPVWHKEANLHLLRLSDLRVDTLPLVNSDNADSYHSWSSDSRWFVFASKRGDGVYGKPWFSHIDANGRTTKPFLMPQRDPEFYDFFMKSYNIPELSSGPAPFTPEDVRRAFIQLEAEPVDVNDYKTEKP
ncbi:MAG: hypothetical protein MUE74_00045 [Bacteroidales bacterium]|nr:hypothetical protein [Bacteroidales bacterium]